MDRSEGRNLEVGGIDCFRRGTIWFGDWIRRVTV